MEQSARDNTKEEARVFGALADPTRLKLVKLLCQQQEANALCVNALAGILGVTQSAVSQHLRILKAIGLVRGERRSYHIHYYINRDKLRDCRELLLAALNNKEMFPEEPCQKYCPNRREQDVP